jgi:hypothetical protein
MAAAGFLFIGGCARSGTSALWQVVTADPGVSLGLERYGRFAARAKEFGPDLFAPERFLDIRESDTFYDSFDAFPNTRYPEVVERFDRARLVGDKIPRLHPLYGRIADSFPEARILYILRNPYDVAASFQRRALSTDDRTWTRTRDYRAACEEWNASLRATRKWLDRLPFYVVDYESFFAGQADIGGMAEFLGLDDVQALMRGYRQQLRRKRRNPPDVLLGYGRQHVSETADFGTYRELLSRAEANRLKGWPPSRPAPRDTRKYADEDDRILDYDYYEAAPGRWFRGPEPEPGRRVAFLGAASTFGRFVERPYASLVCEALDMRPLNLGYGGARAPFYYDDHKLLELINGAECAVIECFSARGTGTRWVETRDHISAFLRLRGSGAEFAFADRFFARLLTQWSERDLLRLRAEIQDAYVAEMRQLFELIEVPKLLLWFSQRSPQLPQGLSSVSEFMGAFPHFVNPSMVEELAQEVDELVEVVTDAGIPNPLVASEDGAPVPIFKNQAQPAENRYYPSPEMHAVAADALTPSLGALIAARARISGSRSPSPALPTAPR